MDGPIPLFEKKQNLPESTISAKNNINTVFKIILKLLKTWIFKSDKILKLVFKELEQMADIVVRTIDMFEGFLPPPLPFID